MQHPTTAAITDKDSARQEIEHEPILFVENQIGGYAVSIYISGI